MALFWLESQGHNSNWLKAKGHFGRHYGRQLFSDLLLRPYGLIWLKSQGHNSSLKAKSHMASNLMAKSRMKIFAIATKLRVFFSKIALHLWIFQNCLVAVLPRYRGFCNSGPLIKNGKLKKAACWMEEKSIGDSWRMKSSKEKPALPNIILTLLIMSWGKKNIFLVYGIVRGRPITPHVIVAVLNTP